MLSSYMTAMKSGLNYGAVGELYSTSFTKLLSNSSVANITPNDYGVSDSVPLVFFSGTGNRILAKTPSGKIVFPARGINPLVGVPYWCYIFHPPGKNVCFASPVGLPDIKAVSYDFWFYIFDERKIHAIKELRGVNGCGLKEAKYFTDDMQNYIQTALLRKSISPDSFCNHMVPVFEKVMSILGFTPPARSSGWSPHSKTPPPYPGHTSSELQNARDMLYRKTQELDRITSDMRQKDQEIRKYRYATETVVEKYNLLEAEFIKLQSSNPAVATKNFNMWDIIGATPEDPYDEIKVKIKMAIVKYHPDMVSRSGELIQKLANEISSALIIFRKQFK